MISVIIPIYNVEKYIKDCLESVIHQKYREFELILINDGSTDRSMAIAKETVNNLSDLSCQIVHTENHGVSCARNEGIKRANGEFIIMIDADDIISPDFLSDYMKMVHDNTNADIYSSGFTVLDIRANRRLTINRQNTNATLFMWDIAQKNFYDRTIKFLLPTLLYRRSFLIDNLIFFDEKVKYSEDVQFIWRCLAYNRKMVIHTGKSNYNYVLHHGSTMTASRLPKIKTCIGGLERLYFDIEDKLTSELHDTFLPRMYFSLLHSTAKITTFKEFSQLYTEANCKTFILRECKSRNLRTKAVSVALIINLWTGYLLMRRF